MEPSNKKKSLLSILRQKELLKEKQTGSKNNMTGDNYIYYNAKAKTSNKSYQNSDDFHFSLASSKIKSKSLRTSKTQGFKNGPLLTSLDQTNSSRTFQKNINSDFSLKNRYINFLYRYEKNNSNSYQSEPEFDYTGYMQESECISSEDLEDQSSKYHKIFEDKCPFSEKKLETIHRRFNGKFIQEK